MKRWHEDMIKPSWRDYAECIVMSLAGVLLAGIIVAFVVWFTVG